MIRAIILWLCNRFDVHPIDEMRLSAGTDAIERGAQWERFYREQGGLADMIGNVRKGYFEAAAALAVSDTDKLYEYALADRIAREIEREVQKVIATGKVEMDRATQLAKQNSARIRR